MLSYFMTVCLPLTDELMIPPTFFLFLTLRNYNKNENKNDDIIIIIIIMINCQHRRRSLVNFRGQDIFSRKICLKN